MTRRKRGEPARGGRAHGAMLPHARRAGVDRGAGRQRDGAGEPGPGLGHPGRGAQGPAPAGRHGRSGPRGRQAARAPQPHQRIGLTPRILRRRPDVGAVVHAHPPVATAFAVAGEAPDPLALPELLLQCGRVPIVPYGTPGTPELGDRIEPYLAGHDAWLLANHGAVTVGPTLDAAWIRMESLEHGARIVFAARALGRVTLLPPDAVARLGAPGNPRGRDD